jgi:hypothetical protein
MPLRQDALTDRRFWAGLYAGAFGQITEEPPEPAAFCSMLGVREKDELKWWREFTGWYPEIFDTSDGYSKDPATVRLALANDVRLRVEFHPGDQYWFLSDADGSESTLANIGPHWALPGLRWEEAIALGDAAPRKGWMAVLLLLPVVWLTAGDDVEAARLAAESAWRRSKLMTPESASLAADLWVKAVEGGRGYRWRRRSNGWLSDAEWSTRSKGRRGAASLNRLIAAAGGS